MTSPQSTPPPLTAPIPIPAPRRAGLQIGQAHPRAASGYARRRHVHDDRHRHRPLPGVRDGPRVCAGARGRAERVLSAGGLLRVSELHAHRADRAGGHDGRGVPPFGRVLREALQGGPGRAGGAPERAAGRDGPDGLRFLIVCFFFSLSHFLTQHFYLRSLSQANFTFFILFIYRNFI
uniref:(northern house mosquito) hypothetical protein n=1 Tax=Culex pipiens TaxID=7175 RepID=A0A8D8D6I2_CULPI